MDNGIEILLVEDDPQDVRLTLRELQRENLKNRSFVSQMSSTQNRHPALPGCSPNLRSRLGPFRRAQPGDR
jgi:hypothetical protein